MLLHFLNRSDPGWLRSLVKKIGRGAKKVVTAIRNAFKRMYTNGNSSRFVQLFQ